MLSSMHRSRVRQWLILTCLLLGVLFGATSVSAQSGSVESPEVVTQVKAAYLYKFGNYIEWPPASFDSSESPIRIGVAGASQLSEVLQRLVVGRTIGGRSMEVLDLRPGDSVAGLHILFIGDPSGDRLEEIFSEVSGRPILTVTDSERVFALGSMINFVVVDGKLRFDIAPRSARPAGINISARLLTAARKVITSPS